MVSKFVREVNEVRCLHHQVLTPLIHTFGIGDFFVWERHRDPLGIKREKPRQTSYSRIVMLIVDLLLGQEGSSLTSERRCPMVPREIPVMILIIIVLLRFSRPEKVVQEPFLGILLRFHRPSAVVVMRVRILSFDHLLILAHHVCFRVFTVRDTIPGKVCRT